jgi:hypothetical protein
MSQELARTELEALGSAWETAWAGRDGASFADCCTADVQYEDPLTAEPLHGPSALAGHAERLRAALPDLRLERAGERLGGVGYACLPWRLAATHRGDAGALPATNRFLVLHGLHYLELSDDRVRRARGFFDLYDAAIQLGLLPKRGSLGESALLVLRGFGLRRPTPP